jgi:hypothetical protein
MLFTAWLAATVLAQSTPAWTASVSVEPTRESLQYRFDNPSSFDTTALVPHFFEQTYDTSNVWIGGRLTYPLLGHAAETRVAATPSSTRSADDFDTFFQPDGNIVRSGTTGNATIRSLQVLERIAANRVRGVDVGVSLGYRRDTARYHDGIGIVRTTSPPTEVRRLVTTREFVTSQLFEAGVFGSRSSARFSGIVDVIAVGAGRLAVQLPDKYPGRTIVAVGRYSSATAEATYTRRVGPAVARLSLRAGASLPWRHSSAVRIRRLSLLLSLGTND